MRPPTLLREVVRKRFTDGRQLESRNAQPGSLGADFGWFGIDFWSEVNALIKDGGVAQRELKTLNDWRNAIAHQNFNELSGDAPPNLSLNQVRQWRRTCDCLARSFDEALRRYLHKLTGEPPWASESK